LSVSQSLKIVKTNLNNLGIEHDNFVRETTIIKNKEVEKVVSLTKLSCSIPKLLRFVLTIFKDCETDNFTSSSFIVSNS
jgi:hypothetical protein